MKKALGIAAVIGAAIVYGATVIAQAHATRLEQHASETFWIQRPGYSAYQVSVTAICDTGNGTMIYTILGANDHTHIQPNGCRKKPAEK